MHQTILMHANIDKCTECRHICGDRAESNVIQPV